MNVSLSCWWQTISDRQLFNIDSQSFIINCSEGMRFEDLYTEDDWKEGATLVTTTVDSVEEPGWLLTILRHVCRTKKNTIVCNLKVIASSSQNDTFVFDIDVVEFVRSYCCSSSQARQSSVRELSLLATIRDSPSDEADKDLISLKSSLRTGWKVGHAVICSTDGKVLLDGATRVFLLDSMLRQGVDVPAEVPVVTCLPSTPAWIINAMLVSLSESTDRRIWSPSDTLNLASYQVDSLRFCEPNVKQNAIEKMRTMKVFMGFCEFIDLAVLVNSREICLDLARNLAMKKGTLWFYNILSTKAAVENCKKIVVGSNFTKEPCDKLMLQFFSKLKVLKSERGGDSTSTVVSDACNDIFRNFETHSLKHGIHVEYTLESSNLRKVKLKWCSKTFRHLSNSHYVCAAPQYSRFEIRTVNPNVLIATKLVSSLVPALGCMQGSEKTAWLGGNGVTNVTVTALTSDCMHEDDCDSEPESHIRASVAQAPSPVTKKTARPVSAFKPNQILKHTHLYLPHVLKQELWLSLTSVEYNFQTLWNYLKKNGSDTQSFEKKMEARLRSLCMYHADLYSDPRFNDIGSRLIQDAKSIRKGSRPSKFQKILRLRPHVSKLHMPGFCLLLPYVLPSP